MPIMTGDPKKRVQTLLNVIAQSYHRQATNRDPAYRAEQMKKVNAWLEELTTLHETNPSVWL
jgi:hypothetical protein